MVKKYIMVEGEGIDVEYVALSAKLARKILKTGISESKLDDIICESSTESGVCHASFVLDGQTVGSMSITNFDAVRIQKIGGRKGWFLFKEQNEKGVFRKIKLNDHFDFSKVKCSASHFEINGFRFGYLDISYDGDEGDFGQTVTSHTEGWLILSPDGERLNFEITEQESEDEEDENGSRVGGAVRGGSLQICCGSKESANAVQEFLGDGWPVKISEICDGIDNVLVIIGSKSVLQAVEQAVHRNDELFGRVQTQWI